jgi:hypothetical protein
MERKSQYKKNFLNYFFLSNNEFQSSSLKYLITDRILGLYIGINPKNIFISTKDAIFMVSIKALMARAAKFITDISWDTNWRLYLSMFDLEHLAEDVPRLYRSQSFGDPDYPTCVFHLLTLIAKTDEKLAVEFISYLLSKEFDLAKDEIISQDPILLKELGLVQEEKAGNFSVLPIQITIEKLIEIKTLPHDFYYELQDQINKAYAYDILPAVQILSRKFLENLIIDILRKKYTMKNVDLFYNKGFGRFHGFNTLLKNVSDRIDDFTAISPVFDKDFLKLINNFREQGNSSAHTIELKHDRSQIKKQGEEFEYIIKVLVKVYQAI